MQQGNNDGDTSIHLATRLGKINCLMVLCKAVDKETLNIPNDAGEIVLHLAIASENHQAFALFLQKGADVNLKVCFAIDLYFQH